MTANSWTRLAAIVSLAMVSACGSGRPRGDTVGDQNGVSGACTDNSQCTSGICDGGVCVDGSTCGTSADCEGTQYCHFPSTPDPWVAGTTGTCNQPCTSDDSCGIIGQQCVSGRCYTNVSCNPANSNNDCPPGEVCNQQTRSCNAPPSRCYFNTDCPASWVCMDNNCVDPDDINLGGCANDADCSSVAGCQGGNCACVSGACQPQGGCATDGDCGATQRCNAGVCQNATSCTDQAGCTPYGLVCTGGYCKTPTPCGSGNTCANGYVCKTNYTPPACFPPGTPDCTRNEQCPQGQYCEVFSSTCQEGCRSDTDCAGGCDGQVPCRCGSTGECSTSTTGTPGGTCTSNDQCPGGTVCSYNDPNGALMCDFGMGEDCSKSCRVTCDMLMSQLMETCPSGQKCGGDGGLDAMFMQVILQMMGSSGGGTGSVCY